MKYRLVESAWYCQVAVWSYHDGDWFCVRRLAGIEADDLAELYRAAPDEEHRQMILKAAVEGRE